MKLSPFDCQSESDVHNSSSLSIVFENLQIKVFSKDSFQCRRGISKIKRRDQSVLFFSLETILPGSSLDIAVEIY